jgi:hypothetical protein
VSLTLGAVRLHIETLSYKREARLLAVCRVRLEVHIAEFAGCDQARSAATKARTGARQSGGWRSWWLLWWQSHRFRCAAKTGRGIADEDRASAMFVDAGDRCRPAIAPNRAPPRGWGTMPAVRRIGVSVAARLPAESLHAA